MTVAYRGSEVSDFLRCRRKWHLRWNEGYVPKKQNDKLFFGQLFHKWAETLYKTKDLIESDKEMKSLFDESHSNGQEQQELDGIWDMALEVTGGYVKKWWENDKNWEIIDVEMEFDIPIDELVSYTGTIDLVFRDKRTGKVWFMDHKTTSSLDLYENNARMDRQISRYWWALEKLGYDVAGFIYNIILKDFPVAPKVLKSGKLSTAKNQNTTYELYLEAIESNNLDRSDYEEFLTQLQETPREYFRRVVVKRNPQEIAHAMYEFYHQALEANLLKGAASKNDHTYIYRNITRDCSWDCPFKDVCKAELDGSNVSLLLNTLFTKEEVNNG